jgi:26S proteasome regulatory subunit T3
MPLYQSLIRCHSYLFVFQISAAEISAICQEAGMQAVRRNRYVILSKDFDEAYKKLVKKQDKEFSFYST